jgi:phosphate starvation-inducible PhoH-like protein
MRKKRSTTTTESTPKTTRKSASHNQIKKTLVPKSQNQAEYIRCIAENDITFCKGPAGSGKTAIAVGLACEYLIANKVSKIVITRPVIESGKGLGFLPGTMMEKVNPYLIPILEEMKQYLGQEVLYAYKANNTIEICPLEYMRGRNFHDTFMILDEGQNCTFEQIKMFVTRLGINSKAVINGDTDQSDLPEYTKGGLDKFIDRLINLRGIGLCELTSADIVRNNLISKILERLK